MRQGAFARRWAEVARAAEDGDEATSASVGEIATQELFEWGGELEQLRGQAADPALRAAIAAAAASLKQLAAAEDQTPVGEMTARVDAARASTAPVCGSD
ncbi:hypothetical protein [Pilimelia columellifera]|uniref:Uncharacterized protein n=1 Tax=Pilimelia columellifera subsp. columellifera TaxID=706583 RepID=A0ABN3NPJ6_9ACTN